jgi:hypothetical protein
VADVSAGAETEKEADWPTKTVAAAGCAPRTGAVAVAVVPPPPQAPSKADKPRAVQEPNGVAAMRGVCGISRPFVSFKAWPTRATRLRRMLSMRAPSLGAMLRAANALGVTALESVQKSRGYLAYPRLEAGATLER